MEYMETVDLGSAKQAELLRSLQEADSKAGGSQPTYVL